MCHTLSCNLHDVSLMTLTQFKETADKLPLWGSALYYQVATALLLWMPGVQAGK